MEQFAFPLEHGVLGLGAACGGEAVVRVAGKTTREVLAHIAVSNLLGAVHQHLSAVVELWDAVDGEQQGQGLLEHGGVLGVA